MEPVIDLAVRECRAARRLTRLFRIERRGRFERHSVETVRQLIGRRAVLVDELAQLEANRHALGAPLPAELGAALGELAREVGAARQSCLARSEQLAAELAQRRGEGRATGLRGGSAGQLLGSV